MEHQNVIGYYQKTRFDYWVAWMSRDNPAIHFGYYDDKARVHKTALIRLNEVMAEMAGIGPGCRVLDAGCGFGAGAVWLAKEKEAIVTGITPVPYQIAGARELANENGLDGRVFFEEGNYHQTSFPDNSFDVVWACESLCHSPEKAAFYREAFRLLRPGGRLVLAEYVRSGRPLGPQQESLLSEWLSGWAIPDLDTREEHFANGEKAGFSKMEIKDVTNHTWVSHRNLFQHGKRWWRLGQLLTAAGIRNTVQHGNHRGAIRQFEALEAQAWYYGLGLFIKRK